MHGRGDTRKIGGDVMLKAALANKVQQLLHPGNFDDSCAPERAQRAVCESAFAHVAAYSAAGIIGGEARKTHGLGLDQSHAGAKRILLAHGPRNDLLEVHLH